MGFRGVSLTEVNHKTTESAEQDQPARMCMLILLYTLRKKQIKGRKWKNNDDYTVKCILIIYLYIPTFLSNPLAVSEKQLLQLQFGVCAYARTCMGDCVRPSELLQLWMDFNII